MFTEKSEKHPLHQLEGRIFPIWRRPSLAIPPKGDVPPQVSHIAVGPGHDERHELCDPRVASLETERHVGTPSFVSCKNGNACSDDGRHRNPRRSRPSRNRIDRKYMDLRPSVLGAVHKSPLKHLRDGEARHRAAAPAQEHDSNVDSLSAYEVEDGAYRFFGRCIHARAADRPRAIVKTLGTRHSARLGSQLNAPWTVEDLELGILRPTENPTSKVRDLLAEAASPRCFWRPMPYGVSGAVAYDGDRRLLRTRPG